jgi:hypothetical protein
MSQISFFQRYTQRENHATNNTLLALRYFYEAAPAKLEQVLNSVLDQELSIGLRFEQQIRGSQSIPDAVITQPSFRIIIETKLDGALQLQQIKNHLKSICADAHASDLILIGLTKNKTGARDQTEIHEMAAKAGIRFQAVTFAELFEALSQACAEYDVQLRAVVDDYGAYLQEEGLLHDRDNWLAVFPCGTSFEENVRFGVYYEPASRPSKSNCRYIGIYKSKLVSFIGEIRAILVDGDEEAEFGAANPETFNKVEEVIRNTPYYDLRNVEPHRFYLVDKFYETALAKSSPGGMMHSRRFQLDSLIGEDKPARNLSAQEIASKLNGKTFS